ncbi:MAG: YdeI/OmpD-associated family protein [Planctomycetota bacterium]
MVTVDPRIDSYIRKAPAFARPILTEIRARVHAACPEVVETVKWRNPSFEHQGLLGGMAAFKAYCTFGFWKDAVLRQDPGLAAVLDRCGRLSTAGDLPPRASFTKAVEQAMRLNAAGVALPRRKAGSRPPIPMHPAFARALAAAKTAKANFDRFPPSSQREYLEWIADAKQEATRDRRIEQAVAWLAEGKRRNWKYETC